MYLNGAGKLYFNSLMVLKIVLILCILSLIEVCLGFCLDFWGLILVDLIIYGLLVGILDGM